MASIIFQDINKMVAEEFYRIFPDAKMQIAKSNQNKYEIKSWVRCLIEQRCTGITKKGERCKINFCQYMIPPLREYIDGISDRCGFHEGKPRR